MFNNANIIEPTFIKNLVLSQFVDKKSKNYKLRNKVIINLIITVKGKEFNTNKIYWSSI